MKKTSSKPAFILEKISNHLETAYNFGFTPIETPEYATKAPKKNSELHNDRLSFLSFFIKEELHKKNPPLMYAYELPYKKSGKRKNPKVVNMALDITGTLQSISDALVIKTAMAILSDEGYKDLSVDINSVGDRESFNKLEKDLNNYYRKNINSLPANLRQSFKKSIWNIFSSTDSRIDEWRESAPQPMNCLSDISRRHFKEVLEYLETLDIPYKINPTLIGERGVSVHTMFEIKAKVKGKKDDVVLAKGTRTNVSGKDVGYRKDIIGISVELNFPKKKKATTVNLAKAKKPELFFVQLGFEARMQSLNVIDMLRKNKIKVAHSLTRDKITAQMAFAERLAVSNILIMGQREALEKSVVVRDMDSRSQNSVAIANLLDYLKKNKKS